MHTHRCLDKCYRPDTAHLNLLVGVVLILAGSAAGTAFLLVLARLIFGRRVHSDPAAAANQH